MSQYVSIAAKTQVTPAATASNKTGVERVINNDYQDSKHLLPIQFKLAVGAVDDPMEYEADAMADKVMRMPEQDFKPSFIRSHSIQRKCNHCEAEENDGIAQRKPLVSFIQRKENTKSETSASDVVTSQISATKGNGNSMDGKTQSFMENRFGTGFQDVRIHTGGYASELSQQLNAKAFTVGNDVYFNQGKYMPNTMEGKHLLAHELTHTIQQKGFLQRQTMMPPSSKGNINIVAELLDLPPSDDASIVETVPGIENMVVPEALPMQKTVPYLEVLRKSFIQRDDATATQTIIPAPVPRKDLVFIMGTAGGFYVAAKNFFAQHHPEAEIVDFKDRSLGGIFAMLRKDISDTTPAGNIYIVSHANQDGTLSFPLNSKDKDKTLTFGELKDAIANQSAMFNLNGGIDEKTFIQIKGCNIGRNTAMLDEVDKAFGGKEKVDAPTHKQGYESHKERKGKISTPVSSEFFNTLILEYPGNAKKSTDELVADFKTKYSSFAYKDNEWQMMVLGIKKYTQLIDKQSRDKKKAIDDDAKDKKKDIDKADKDAFKVVHADTKTAKAAVDAWAKDMKTSKVANKSPGVKSKVDQKFTATLYNNVDPAIGTTKALTVANTLIGKGMPKGFAVSKCNSIIANSNEPLSFDFEFEIKNKAGDTNTLTVTTPKLPKTEKDSNDIANELLDETVAKKPEVEVARRDMYQWRVEKKNAKNMVDIKAFLEMTQYTVDVDLEEELGSKIDPAQKEGDDFYYGNSD